MSEKKKIAIVTGATGGIGSEFIKQLVKEDLDEIWMIARNTEKLSELQQNYGMKLIVVALDLCKQEAIEFLQERLKKEEPDIQYLINNAGLAKMGSYQDFTLEEISKTINLNCTVPAILCRICIQYMKAGSRILNLSSAASFQPNPYLNLYAASKVFERSYSRALNVELKGTGVTATAVCPGWVDTELLNKEINGKQVRFPGMVSAERVVKKALIDAKKGKDMSVCSLYVKLQHLYVKLMPQKLIMKLWVKGIKDYR